MNLRSKYMSKSSVRQAVALKDLMILALEIEREYQPFEQKAQEKHYLAVPLDVAQQLLKQVKKYDQNLAFIYQRMREIVVNLRSLAEDPAVEIKIEESTLQIGPVLRQLESLWWQCVRSRAAAARAYDSVTTEYGVYQAGLYDSEKKLGMLQQVIPKLLSPKNKNAQDLQNKVRDLRESISFYQTLGAPSKELNLLLGHLLSALAELPQEKKIEVFSEDGPHLGQHGWLKILGDLVKLGQADFKKINILADIDPHIRTAIESQPVTTIDYKENHSFRQLMRLSGTKHKHKYQYVYTPTLGAASIEQVVTILRSFQKSLKEQAEEWKKQSTHPSGQSGPPGPSDPSGQSGQSGQSGPPGPSDPSDPSGQSGPPGPSDPSGQPGPSDPLGQSRQLELIDLNISILIYALQECAGKVKNVKEQLNNYREKYEQHLKILDQTEEFAKKRTEAVQHMLIEQIEIFNLPRLLEHAYQPPDSLPSVETLREQAEQWRTRVIDQQHRNHQWTQLVTQTLELTNYRGDLSTKINTLALLLKEAKRLIKAPFTSVTKKRSEGATETDQETVAKQIIRLQKFYQALEPLPARKVVTQLFEKNIAALAKEIIQIEQRFHKLDQLQKKEEKQPKSWKKLLKLWDKEAKTQLIDMMGTQFMITPMSQLEDVIEKFIEQLDEGSWLIKRSRSSPIGITVKKLLDQLHSYTGDTPLEEIVKLLGNKRVEIYYHIKSALSVKPNVLKNIEFIFRKLKDQLIEMQKENTASEVKQGDQTYQKLYKIIYDLMNRQQSKIPDSRRQSYIEMNLNELLQATQGVQKTVFNFLSAVAEAGGFIGFQSDLYLRILENGRLQSPAQARRGLLSLITEEEIALMRLAGGSSTDPTLLLLIDVAARLDVIYDDALEILWGSYDLSMRWKKVCQQKADMEKILNDTATDKSLLTGSLRERFSAWSIQARGQFYFPQEEKPSLSLIPRITVKKSQALSEDKQEEEIKVIDGGLWPSIHGLPLPPFGQLRQEIAELLELPSDNKKVPVSDDLVQSLVESDAKVESLVQLPIPQFLAVWFDPVLNDAHDLDDPGYTPRREQLKKPLLNAMKSRTLSSPKRHLLSLLVQAKYHYGFINPQKDHYSPLSFCQLPESKDLRAAVQEAGLFHPLKSPHKISSAETETIETQLVKIAAALEVSIFLYQEREGQHLPKPVCYGLDGKKPIYLLQDKSGHFFPLLPIDKIKQCYKQLVQQITTAPVLSSSPVTLYSSRPVERDAYKGQEARFS
jgi:hypothetical protein